jgi:hypothetical protein
VDLSFDLLDVKGPVFCASVVDAQPATSSRAAGPPPRVLCPRGSRGPENLGRPPKRELRTYLFCVSAFVRQTFGTGRGEEVPGVGFAIAAGPPPAVGSRALADAVPLSFGSKGQASQNVRVRFRRCPCLAA